ncbi:ZIP family metal transporter [Georgenia muralis]
MVLAVVGLGLMPEALASSTPWVPILAFVGGGRFFLALDKVIGYVQARFAPDGESGPWAIFSGVSLDLFSDGVMIGTGTVVNPRRPGAGRCPRRLRRGGDPTPSGSLARSAPGTGGRLRRPDPDRSHPGLLRPAFRAGTGHPLSVLALTGGALTAVVIEEMIPQAHTSNSENDEEDTEEPRLNALALVAGFALFAVISAYFGE